MNLKDVKWDAVELGEVRRTNEAYKVKGHKRPRRWKSAKGLGSHLTRIQKC